MTDSIQTPTVFLFPDGRMNAKNAAIYLGLSPKTLAMWRCQGKGPDFIKRGRIFYFKDALDRWVHSGERCGELPRYTEAA
jgi:hypothetical protein